MVYPDSRLNDRESNFDSRSLVGKMGLNRLMRYTSSTVPAARYDFEYATSEYGNIFSPSEIGKYTDLFSIFQIS